MKLTDRTQYSAASANDIIHVVVTGDTSQNPSGSSYKMTLQQVIDLASSSSINISDALYTVNNNLNANNTTTATTSICTYGVNVFTGVTTSDYATKLPQPVTGKSVKIINNGSATLSIYPSNIGGKINNYAVNVPAQIPPDGKPYEFICIVNPLPGAWTFSTPATNQYDSGEITITVTGGTGPSTNKIVSAADTNNVGIGNGFSSQNWGYDGKNKPLIMQVNYSGTYFVFKPANGWLGVSKIKVYTNLIDNSSTTEVRLMGNGETDYYDLADGSFITNGASSANSTLFRFSVDKQISGSNSATGYTSTNIGDNGTFWGEQVANINIYSNTSFGDTTFIGDKGGPTVTYPYGSPSQYIGQQVSSNYTSYISFQIRPLPYTVYNTITDFKFRFIIEYYQ